jgi:hypothetical protein
MPGSGASSLRRTPGSGVLADLGPGADRPIAIFGHGMGATPGVEASGTAGLVRLFVFGRTGAVRAAGRRRAELKKLSGVLGDEEIMRREPRRSPGGRKLPSPGAVRSRVTR